MSQFMTVQVAHPVVGGESDLRGHGDRLQSLMDHFCTNDYEHHTAKSCRHAFTETLLEVARTDTRIGAVTSDAKGSVTLGDFEKSLPGQFLELGIAEQFLCE